MILYRVQQSFLIFTILLTLLSSNFSIGGNIIGIFMINPIVAIIMYGIYVMLATWFVAIIAASVVTIAFWVIFLGILGYVGIGIAYARFFVIYID